MIDTHCHLLPGLDDGPTDEAEALALARRLVEDGVTAAVCTPHWSSRFPTEHGAAAAALERLRRVLDEEGVELELLLSAELAPLVALDADPETLAVRALAGRFVLVETLPDSPLPFFETAVDRLADLGFAVIFAHPERCRAVRRNLDVLDAARAAGALVQVVAPSVLGRWGAEVAAAARAILDEGLADLLASDAHGPRRRGTHLNEAAAEVRRRVGADAAVSLTETVPGLVVRGRHPDD